MDTKDWQAVMEFVISVRVRARQDQQYAGTTPKARTKLIIQIEGPLANKKNRIPVLQAITGLMLDSQNRLTSWYTQVLIDETLEGKSDAILQNIERYIESRAGEQPWSLFPWERNVSDLSGMPTSDN